MVKAKPPAGHKAIKIVKLSIDNTFFIVSPYLYPVVIIFAQQVAKLFFWENMFAIFMRERNTLNSKAFFLGSPKV